MTDTQSSESNTLFGVDSKREFPKKCVQCGQKLTHDTLNLANLTIECPECSNVMLYSKSGYKDED